MIKYKCAKCGASCKTSHCYDCDIDIPMSQRFDDGTGNDGDAAINLSVLSNRDVPHTVSYKCPECGAMCRTSHCFDCDIDLPMTSRFDSEIGYVSDNPTTVCNSGDFDKNIGKYFSLNNRGKRFKIKDDDTSYKFSDLVNYELCEDNSTIQKGGVGRAIVGGVLFGEVGAIVGAQTRKSQNVVGSLYIRLTLKSVGMKKIIFINSSTDRNGFIYKTARRSADEVVSELELIISENQNIANQTASQSQYEPQLASSPVQQPIPTGQPQISVADELLKLKQLLDMGVLTQEEFAQQKQKLLNG